MSKKYRLNQKFINSVAALPGGSEIARALQLRAVFERHAQAARAHGRHEVAEAYEHSLAILDRWGGGHRALTR